MLLLRRVKRWVLILVALIALVSVAVALRKQRRATANAAAIKAAFQHYAENLKPGLTRKQVKDYLQAHGVIFHERCCSGPQGTFSVLVQVGEEDAPWYCSDVVDYLTLEFNTEGERGSGPTDADVLRSLYLTSIGEGCL